MTSMATGWPADHFYYGECCADPEAEDPTKNPLLDEGIPILEPIGTQYTGPLPSNCIRPGVKSSAMDAKDKKAGSKYILNIVKFDQDVTKQECEACGITGSTYELVGKRTCNGVSCAAGKCSLITKLKSKCIGYLVNWSPRNSWFSLNCCRTSDDC